ncbi:Serine/threonine-protein kinase [Hordeum vulgare]|nr:Serine/threonine-protein kinase [Hordeum vulgare]
MMEISINTMERFLTADDKFKLVSFDLAYTNGRARHDQKVAFAHLCMRHHVVLYHCCLATMPYEHFTRFVNSLDYRFALVNTTNDPKMLKTLGLAYVKHVDIHNHCEVWGSKKAKDSHVDLIVDIIDPYYIDMKAECEKNKHVWHKACVKRWMDITSRLRRRMRTHAMRCSHRSLT